MLLQLQQFDQNGVESLHKILLDELVEDVRGKAGFDVGHLNLVDGSLVNTVFEGDQF